MLTHNSGNRAIYLTSCFLLLAAVNEIGYSQNQVFEEKPEPPVLPVLPSIPPKPPLPSVDQLIDSLEKLRKQKAALEDQERFLVEKIREGLREQEERLSKLQLAGFTPPQKSASEKAPQKPGWVIEADASKYVRQLGSASFTERELAERQLLELGLKAKPTILTGTRNSDPEIARRCEDLVKRLRKGELEDFRLNKADWPSTAGARFRSLTGDSPESRTLFASLMADDNRAAMIELACADPKVTFREYAIRLRELQKAGHTVFETYTGRLADQEWWLRYRDASRKAVAPEELVTVFFLGSFPLPEDAVDPHEIDHALRATFLDLAAGPEKEPFGKLYGAWLNQRRHPDAVRAGMEASLYGAIPDAVWVARRHVIDPKASPRVVSAAATVLGHHGNISDLLPLSRRRKDERVANGGLAGDSLRYEVQVQDVAAAMSLRLRSQMMERFKFNTSRWVGHWFGPDRPPCETLNYVSQEERPVILKEAWEWLDQQKDAPPKPTPDSLLGK